MKAKECLNTYVWYSCPMSYLLSWAILIPSGANLIHSLIPSYYSLMLLFHIISENSSVNYPFLPNVPHFVEAELVFTLNFRLSGTHSCGRASELWCYQPEHAQREEWDLSGDLQQECHLKQTGTLSHRKVSLYFKAFRKV